MALRTKRVKIKKSRWGSLALVMLTLFIVGIIPYKLIMMFGTRVSFTGVVLIGAVSQLIGVGLVLFGVIPSLKKIIGHAAPLKKAMFASSTGIVEGFNRYVDLWREGRTRKVINVVFGDVIGEDSETVYIEFVSDRRFGVIQSSLSEIVEGDPEEMDSVNVDKDYETNYGNCVIVNDCGRTKYRVPIYDKPTDDSAGVPYACLDCLEELLEQSQELVAADTPEEAVSRAI